MKNSTPKSAKKSNKTMTVLTDTARTRKIARGISGWCTRCSMSTKAARRAKPAATRPRVLAAPQPQFCALTKP